MTDPRVIIEKSRKDPEWFVRNILGGDPWQLQVDIMNAVRDYPEVAVKSCHSAGKSWLAGQIVMWFLLTHRPSIVITTAPTDRQVRGILWKEIRLAYKRAKIPIGGQLLTQELRLADDWWAWGFTAPDWDPDRFQGFHEENVMVVIDEAAGVSTQIYDAIDAVLSSEHIRKLEIGNPTDDSGGFGRSFKQSDIKKFTIPAFVTPNFAEFGITNKDIMDDTWERKVVGKPLPNPYLVTPAWVARRARRWGMDSPMYRSRVMAEFPEVGADALISMSWYDAAKERRIEPATDDENTIGVDVARFGSDETIIYHRHGGRVRLYKALGMSTIPETIGHTIRALHDTNAKYALIDGVGVGAGVVDGVLDRGYPVRELNAGAKAADQKQFYNAKAEWYWKVREMFQFGQIDVDPEDEELESQATSIKYKILPSGQIRIEDKEEYRKRVGGSPDRFEALVHALADEQQEPFDSW